MRTAIFYRIRLTFVVIDVVFGNAFFEDAAFHIVASHAVVKGIITFFPMFPAILVIVGLADGYAFFGFVGVIAFFAGIDTFPRDA